MHISEIFYSIQGEGHLAGRPSSFIRLAGCPLRCRWCDTKYAQSAHDAESLTVEQIIERVNSHHCGYIVVTGGEPLVAAELPELLERLAAAKKHITLETAATTYRPIVCDLVSISPKLANSAPLPPGSPEAVAHDMKRLNIPAIQKYIDNYDTQLKFVVSKPSDLLEVEQLLSQLENVKPGTAMLMPQAQTREQYRRLAPEIAQLCIDHNYDFGSRLHLELWGNVRKK
ncbi:MAG: 7-carboxy-7-deazaguanine synthase QueE [Phycisphaerae bacterium]|nr:7-carboxy-7-deazaguanine synthase QueE [Phycisphaerae bacterium]